MKGVGTRRGQRNLALWLRRAGIALALTACFALALAVAVIVHLDLAAVRRTTERSVNALFAAQFEGTVRVEGVRKLSLAGVRVDRFRALAPSGAEVILAEGIEARGLGVGALVVAIVRGDGAFIVEQASIERAAVSLARDPDDELEIARAFRPRQRPEEPPEPPKEPSRRGIGFSLGAFAIAEGTVTGPIGPRSLDGRARAIAGWLEIRPNELSLSVERASVEEHGLCGASTRGDGRMGLYVAGLQPLLWAELRGSLAGIALEAALRIERGALAGRVEAARVAGSDLRPWLGDDAARFAGPVALRAAVALALPRAIAGQKPPAPTLALFAAVDVPNGEAPGQLEVGGALALGEDPVLDLTVRGERLDLQAVVAAAPRTALGALLRLRARLDGRDSELSASFASEPGAIAGQAIPAASGRAAFGPGGLEVAAQVDEPGSRTELGLSLAGDRGRAAARMHVPRLEELPRLRAVLDHELALRGAANVAARGHWHGRELSFGWSAALVGVSLQKPRVSLPAAALSGRIEGEASALALDAVASAPAVELDGRRLESLRVSARGPLGAPSLRAELVDDAGRELDARALLVPARAALERLEVELRHGPAHLSGKVARLSQAAGRVRLDGIELGGIGGPLRGELEIGGGEVTGTLAGRGIELGPLSRIVGLPYRLSGLASVDVDLARTAEGRRGRVHVALEDAGMLVVTGVGLDLDVAFEGRELRPTATVQLGSAAAAREGERCSGLLADLAVRDAALTLGGPLLDPESWRRIEGEARLDAKTLDLPCLGQTWALIFPSQPLPLAKLEGTAAGSVVLAHRRADPLPSVRDLSLRTSGLVLVPRAPEGEPPAWSSEHVDLDLRGDFDGASGRLSTRLALRHRQPEGELVHVAAETTVDPHAWREGGARLRSALGKAPLSIALESDAESLARWAELPAPLGSYFAGLRGELELDAYLDGSLARPRLSTRVLGKQIVQRDGALTTPLDLEVLASYQAEDAQLVLELGNRGRSYASIEASGNGPLAFALDEGGVRPNLDRGWTGGAALRFYELPLEVVPAFAGERLHGRLSGELRARGLGTEPTLSADLDVANLRFGQHLGFRRAHVSLRPTVEPETVLLDARFEGRRGGVLIATGYGAIDWQDRLVPAIDPEDPAALQVTAEHFSLSALQPLFEPEVTRLDGDLHGSVLIGWKTLADRDLDLGVALRVSDGAVSIPRIGQELHAIGAHVRTEGDELLVDLSASGPGDALVTGMLEVRRTGLDIRDVTGELSVGADHPLPVSIEGVQLGRASGTVTVRGEKRTSADGRALLSLSLSGEDLHIALPPSAGGDVQRLEDHPDVELSHPLAPPAAPEDGGDGLRYAVTIGLANLVLEGASVRLAFDTKEAIQIASGEKPSGELSVRGGEFDLLGKVFTLDRGTVILRPEEPDKPYVNVTSHWASPDGTIVYCDFVGTLPVTGDKIRFRSSPPRPEQEVLSFLLLGGSFQERGPLDTEPGAGEQAANLGRGIAAAQFNALLGNIAPRLTTSFGTTREGYVATSLIYQISEKVTAAATYESQSGETALGSAGGDTARTKVSVDWRFHPKWLVRGTAGFGEKAASGVDLLFQHQY